MAKYKIGTDLYDLPEDKIESFKTTYPDAVEVTDPEEGKTNGVAEKGATVTPTTGQAPESYGIRIGRYFLWYSQPKRSVRA